MGNHSARIVARFVVMHQHEGRCAAKGLLRHRLQYRMPQQYHKRDEHQQQHRRLHVWL